MSRKLKLFFTISVLINLLLIGTLTGIMVKCHARPDVNMKGMAKVSPEGKAMIADTFAKSRDDMNDIFQNSRDARADVVTILEADQFDKAAFKKASDILRVYQTKIMQRRINAAADLAEHLSPQDRKLLAEWLAGPGGHPPGKYFPVGNNPPKSAPVNAPAPTPDADKKP